MTDDDYKDLVLEHDKVIEGITKTIAHFDGTLGTTNRKLEDILSVISNQTLLAERFHNLEITLKESFDRVHAKSTGLENKIFDLSREVSRNSSDCMVYKEKIEVANKRVLKLENSVTWIVRVIIGSLFAGLVSSLFILARS